jgi:hypothetical protein
MTGHGRGAPWLALLAWCVASTTVRAEPWLAPGDPAIRADIQLLADAGILRGPVTTWPLSYPDIARDALAASAADLDDATAAALSRIQRLGRAASTRGFTGIGLRAGGSSDPYPLRSFTDQLRANGELSASAGWLGDHLALQLNVTAVADPQDEKTLRADGSYLGVNVGNFMVSVGYMDRWWGPGWDGSLILSTNARPMPALMLERNYTDPFKTRWLSWLGHWRASIAVGQAEGGGVAVPDVKFMAARVNFRPARWLEVGLSRTAQWCGGDRHCGWDTFTDMLLGKDNQEADGTTNLQPGNQMAGYDLRLSSPWRALPAALYSQLIGEDEAGGLPSKFIWLMGAETWMRTGGGNLRLHAEFADTACEFSREQPQFDCAYRNSIYPQGYTYRGQIIGHSIDNDSRQYSVGALLTTRGGTELSLLARKVEFNRDGGAHTISEVPLQVEDVELGYSRAIKGMKIRLGVGLGDDIRDPGEGSSLRGFLIWQQGY